MATVAAGGELGGGEEPFGNVFDRKGAREVISVERKLEKESISKGKSS